MVKKNLIAKKRNFHKIDEENICLPKKQPKLIREFVAKIKAKKKPLFKEESRFFKI